MAYLDSPGYCAAHTKAKAVAEKERQSIYDRRDRDKEAKAFYASKEWRTARAGYLASHPLCNKCKQAAANTVHHTTPAKQLTVLERLNPIYFEQLCGSCHSKHEALVARGVDMYTYTDPLQVTGERE